MVEGVGCVDDSINIKLGDFSLLDALPWASGSFRFWPESGVLDRAAEARSLGEREVLGQGAGWPGKRGAA